MSRYMDTLQAIFQVRIRTSFNVAGDGDVGRAAVRRVVGGGEDNAIGQTGRSATVVVENGVGNGRRRSELVVFGEHDFDPVGGQHFQGAGARQAGQRVRINTEIQGSADSSPLSIITNGLTDREHMPFVETTLERRASMPGSAESHPLLWHGMVRHVAVVGRDELRHVDQLLRPGRLASQRADSFRRRDRVFQRVPVRSQCCFGDRRSAFLPQTAVALDERVGRAVNARVVVRPCFQARLSSVRPALFPVRHPIDQTS